MAQIKSKQIKLVAQGDLIIGDSSADGSILSIGASNQVILSNGTTGAWGYLGQLRDVAGSIVIDTTTTASSVNNFVLSAAATGSEPEIEVTGTDTNIDILITPKGTGVILVPISYSANIVSDNTLITKQYADSVATGLDFKNSVRIGTTGALTGTYVPANETDQAGSGTSVWTGVGTTLVLDGVTLNDGDRILVKDETGTNRRGNGLFTYDKTNGELDRAIDADNTPTNEVSGGLFVFIEEGNTLVETGWVMSIPNGQATLGTDNLEFIQFSAAGVPIAGAGLTKAGQVFDVNVDDVTTTIDGSNRVVVGHDDSTDHTNQVLIGQNASASQATAAWIWLDDLRDNANGGLVILDGVGIASAVNNVRITNSIALSPVTIESAGTDTNIDLNVTAKGVGRVNIDGNSMPDGAAAVRSIFAVQAADTAGDVSVVTSGTGADRLLLFDDSADAITWALASSVGVTDVYISITDGVATQNASGSDTITFTSSEGVDLTVGVTSRVTAALDFSAGLVTENTIDTVNDLVAFYDSSAALHRKTSISNLFGAAGSSFGQIDLTGNTSGDLDVDSDGANDLLTLSGGIGILLTGTAASDIVQISFTRLGMASTVVTLTDTVPFFDDSNTEEPEYRSFGNIFNDLDVVNGIATDGIIVRTAADTYVSRDIVASLVLDEQGIIITNGDGISGNPTIGLDIVGLTIENVVDTANDQIVFYDASAAANRKTTIDEMLSDAGVGIVAEDDAVATGGANEAFVAFFTNTPVADSGITVFFNGLSLRLTGWTRTGTTLTLIDAVNSYSTESGDVISARYVF